MSGESLNILLIEDDPAHAEAIARRLLDGSAGWRVEIAASLREAREILSRRSPDIIVADLNLSDGKALELLAGNSLALPWPVLVMTSHGDETMAVQALKSGALDYVVKSVETFSEMPRIVSRVLREWRLIKERREAEESTRRAKEWAELLNRTVPSAVFTLDTEKRITGWNARAEEITGYRENEILGQTCQVFSMAPCCQYCGLFDEIRLKPMVACECRIRTRNGQIRTVLKNADVIRDENGRVIGGIESFEDITARQEMEEAFRESEAKYRILTETLPLGLYKTSLDGRLLFANPAFLRMTGYDAAELEAIHIRELFVDSQLRDWQVLNWSQGVINSNEYQLRRKQGPAVWVRDVGVKVTPESGEPYFEGSLEDITQRMEAFQELKSRDCLLDAVSRCAELVLRSRHWADVMPEVLQRLGMASGCSRACFVTSRQRFAGEEPPVLDFRWQACGTSWPSGREDGAGLISESGFARWAAELGQNRIVTGRAEDFLPPEKLLLERLAIRSLLMIPVFANGVWRAFICLEEQEQSRIWTGAEMEVLRIAASMLGAAISRQWADEAQHRSEEEKSMILNATIERFACLDSGLRVLWANRATGEALGLPAGALRGLSCNELWPLTGEEPAAVCPACRTRDTRSIQEGELTTRDGRIWLVRAYPVLDSAGELIAITEIGQDITARKRAEKEKDELAEQLRQSQKMESIGRLAGGLAHDFNNLLTGIMGNASLATMELPSGSPLREYIEEIQNAAESAATLTRQLLAFSRKQIIEPQVLDLNELLGGMAKMLKRLIGEDVKLVSRLASGLGRIRVDPGQLEQVVVNLAVNARDAMPGGGQLVIRTMNGLFPESQTGWRPLRTSHDFVVLEVADTGHGMTGEVKQHLFEPFFTTKEKGKGTGLGLATVYGAVRQNGGFIEVESEVGNGTTFRLYFPRIEGPAESLHRMELDQTLPSGRETVLLVEDEDAVRVMAGKMLTRLGYHVICHGDAASVLAAVAGGEPVHLLMTDIIMPGMNGRELARILQERLPGLKVLFTSGYTDDIIVRHGVLEPGLNFIGKPYTPQMLASKVRQVLDGAT